MVIIHIYIPAKEFCLFELCSRNIKSAQVLRLSRISKYKEITVSKIDTYLETYF